MRGASERVRQAVFDAGMLAVAAGALYALGLVLVRGGAAERAAGAGVVLVVLAAAYHRAPAWRLLRRSPAVAVVVGAGLGAALAGLGEDGRLLWLPVLLLVGTLAAAVPGRTLAATAGLMAAGAVAPVLDGDLSARERRLAVVAAAGIVLLAAAAAVALARIERRIRAAAILPPAPAPAPIGGGVDPPASLTPRQRQVVALAARGLRQAEIAGELGISVHQVRRLLRDARERTGSRTTQELVASVVADRADLRPPDSRGLTP